MLLGAVSFPLRELHSGSKDPILPSSVALNGCLFRITFEVSIQKTQ